MVRNWLPPSPSLSGVIYVWSPEECDVVATVGAMFEGLTRSEDFRARRACERLEVRLKKRRPSLESTK